MSTEEQELARDLEALSRRVRKRRVVLYFGRSTFSDNTKYLFLRDVARERDHEVVWCSADAALVASLRAQDLPCMDLTADIDRSIDLLLHAAVAVFCVNPAESLRRSASLNACLAGARTLQLWHGVSVKHLLLRLIPHLGVRDPGIRQAFATASGADVVLSTATMFDQFWQDCFGTTRLVRAGLPRNEVLLRPPQPLELLGSEVDERVEAALTSGRKTVLVVPTWQRNRPTPLSQPAFLTRLLAIVQRGKVNLLYKMHPMVDLDVTVQQRTDAFHILPSGVDLYPLLHRVDLLVTDYSSIMFDFLLTGRPVLGLDLGEDGHERFEPDFSLVPDVPFRHTFTGNDFEARMRAALYDDHLAPQREEMAARIFETDPADACDRLLGLVDRLVEEAVDKPLTVE